MAITTGRLLLSGPAWREVARRLKLSPRELQIVRSVFDDRKELAIARELGISQHTVHTHFERLYHKLGVTSRVELVVRVFVEYLALSNDGKHADAQVSAAQPTH